MITFTFPQTAHEAYVILVPFITLILGLAYFIIPGRMLALLGVEVQGDRPEAKGVGRYLFASFMLALALCCLLVQEPTALQPGLNNALGYAWILSAVGSARPRSSGGKKDVRTYALLLSALGLGFMVLFTVDKVGFGLPHMDQASALINILGLLTVLLGLCLNVYPKRILSLLGMKEQFLGSGIDEALAGLPAGFITAVGIGSLFFNEPQIASLFVQIVMGVGWIFVGIGLIVSMLLDAKLPNGFSKLKLSIAIVSLGMGSYCLLKIFGYL